MISSASSKPEGRQPDRTETAAEAAAGRERAGGNPTEAGIGKTRLATELAKRVQRLDWEALWGACSEAVSEQLDLNGFGAPQPAWRLRAGAAG